MEKSSSGAHILHSQIKNLGKDDEDSFYRIVDFILGHDCLINTPDDFSRTPLYYAVYIGHYKLSIFILACGGCFTESEIWSTSNERIRNILKNWNANLHLFPWNNQEQSMVRWLLDTRVVLWSDPARNRKLVDEVTKQFSTLFDERIIRLGAPKYTSQYFWEKNRRSRMTWQDLNNFHKTRRPLSFFSPRKDAEDRLAKGLSTRKEVTDAEAYSLSLFDEVCNGNEENIISLLARGAKMSSLKHGSGWNLDDLAHLKGWKSVLEYIHRDPLCMDRPRGLLSDLGKLVVTGFDQTFKPDLAFHAAAGSSNARIIYAHYFMLYSNCSSILAEYNLTTKSESSNIATTPPMDLEPEANTLVEIQIKEDPLIFCAILEWVYTGCLTETTFRTLEEKKLIPELRGAAFHFQLQSLSQACGRWMKKQLPIVVATPGQPNTWSAPKFDSILCPYIKEEEKEGFSYDRKQMSACLASKPDRILVAENRPIFVHSALLMSASDYFGPLFSFNSSSNKIVMQETSYDALWNVVSYIYTGKIGSLGSTLNISAILELKQFCFEIMMQHMTPLLDEAFVKAEITEDTALDYLEAAVENNQSELETKCLQCIAPALISLVTKEKERFQHLVVPRLAKVLSYLDPSHASIVKRNLSIHLS